MGTTIAESREGFEQLLAGEDPIILFQGPKTKERWIFSLSSLAFGMDGRTRTGIAMTRSLILMTH